MGEKKMYIDSHVHCRDGKQAYKETIKHALYVAEKSGVDFMIIDDYWNNYEQPWRVVPGIVEFKYQNELNVNISSAPTLDQYMINSNQPIAMLYPVSDKKVVINHHLIREDEWNVRKSSSYRHSYIGNYVKNKMKNTG
jgi:predicted metallo-beta-lactamase superfamily hydrolase